MGISSYQRTLYNRVIEDNTKGFVDISEDMPSLTSDYSEGVVGKGMEYRPDLVAQHYLGDCNLSWMITLANGFTNGIKDYTLGKKLKIPRI